MEHDREALQEKVIEHSVADTWSKAKKEWRLKRIFRETAKCLCGHDIMDNCVIRNIHNNNELIVGNVCVEQFNNSSLSVPSSAFKSLAKLGPGTKANEALLLVASETGVVSESDVEFYKKITTGKGARKHYTIGKSFSQKKYDIRKRINLQIYLGFQSDCPLCDCGDKMRVISTKTGNYFYGCQNYPNGCKNTRPIDKKKLDEFNENEHDSQSTDVGNLTTDDSEEDESDSDTSDSGDEGASVNKKLNVSAMVYRKSLNDKSRSRLDDL